MEFQEVQELRAKRDQVLAELHNEDVLLKNDKPYLNKRAAA
jgi:hypothetical protein